MKKAKDNQTACCEAFTNRLLKVTYSQNTSLT